MSACFVNGTSSLSGQQKVHQVKFEGKNKALHPLCVLAEGKVGGSKKQRMDWNFPHCTAFQEFFDAFAAVQRWCRFSITFLRVVVVLCIETENLKPDWLALYGMAPPSQVQHLNWHSVCSMSLFVPCFFLQSFFTCDVLLKISLLLKTVFFLQGGHTLNFKSWNHNMKLFSFLFFFIISAYAQALKT